MIVDLYGTSGLPLALDGTVLLYGEGVSSERMTPRMLAEHKDVLAPCSELDGPEETYFMHRGIHTGDTGGLLSRNDYRYDVTVLAKGFVGAEPIKTVGHYHPVKPGTAVSYPEIYEVLSGEAHYVLQKVDGDSVDDLVVVTVKAGEKLIIPPGYGHVTINTGEKPLAMSNIIEANFKSVYEPYVSHRGAAVYYYRDRGWVRNDSYEAAGFSKAVPKEKKDMGIDFSRPLFTSVIDSPESFEYVVNPEKYDFNDLWEVVEEITF